MRKISKLRLRYLLGLAIIAVLITLLNPYTHTLHPRLQDTHAHAPSPTPSLVQALEKVTENEDSGQQNETSRELRQMSPAEQRVNEKVEGLQVRQEELPISQESYIQNPPPRDWVEVKKTNPKVKSPSVKNRGKDKSKKGTYEDVTTSLKVVGYSAKELQRRSLTFPENSPLRVFLKEQERRVDHVAATCRSFQPNLADVVAGSRGPHAGLLSIKHLIYDRLNQLTFCPVYKAASTSMTVTMLQLGGLWTPKTKNLPLQKLVHMFYPRISGLAVPTVTVNTTHFLVVRHPLERLLSCYLDKFQNASKDFYYHLYGEKMVQRYRHSLVGLPTHKVQTYKEEVRAALKNTGTRESGEGGRGEGGEGGGGQPHIHLPNNPFAEPIGPTFHEFAEHVIHTNYDDEHWKPYVTHCAPCHLHYEFVLRFESLREDNKWFLEYLNRTGEVAPRWDNPNSSGNTKKLFCEYYSQLSLLQIDNLIKKYRKDLMLYEYQVEDHRKCAKDYAEFKENSVISEGLNATKTITKHTQRKLRYS